MAYIGTKDYWLEHAKQIILADYGDSVSVEEKNKDLLKFGFTDQVQTTLTTIMELPSGTYNETYVYRNLITTFSSSSASDTQICRIEGHTVGSDVSVSTLTQTAGTATCTTGAAHGYASNDWVYMEGANESGYNGIVQITVTSTTQFTYTVASGTASPATGTITATNQKKTFVVQDVTMNGQTQVTLGTALARATRAYIPSQNRATDMVGTGYIYETDTSTSGVPDTASKVHLILNNGANTSQKASTSISNTDYWIVTGFMAHNLTKQASWLDVRLEVRTLGGVFREVEDISVSDGSSQGIFIFEPYLIVPKNSDIRLRATADTNGRDAAGSIQGVLAKVI